MKRNLYILSILFLSVVFSIATQAANTITATVIKGTVLESATGKPIAGAKVSIPNVTSAITGDNGQFELKKTVAGAVLEVYAPGYATKLIPLKYDKNLKIYLIDDSYKTGSNRIASPFLERTAFGNNQDISSHEMRDDFKSGACSIESVLQIAGSGLNVKSHNGMPGSGANMFINGFTSINASSQPLIVINGIPYDNTTVYSLISGNDLTPLSDIDIKDIESITVVKNGASIYGSKAANGVILINTLHGRDEATRINFYAYTGINYEPETKYKMMGASDYKSYLTDMLYSKGMSANEVNALPYINLQKPVVENWGISGNEDYYRYNQSTNWQNEVFNNSFNKNYHINITGGNSDALYAISVGYLGHEGSVKNTSYDRYTARVDASLKLTNWFKLNANMGYVNSDRNLSYEGLNKNFNPIYAGLVKAPFTSGYVYNVGGNETPNLETYDVFNISNPIALTNKTTVFNNRSRFIGDFNGVITFSKSLELSFLLGLTSDRIREKIFLPASGIYHTPLASAEVTNESKQLRNSLMQINTDIHLKYNHTFDLVHNLTAIVGSRYQNSNSELTWGQAYNTSSDEMKTLGDGKSTMAQIGGSLGSWKSTSNYLNLEYSYLNRYFLSANAAMDGNSRFGADAKGFKFMKDVYGIFPSVDAAWIVSSGNCFDIKEFDQLKLRAGYSETGNDDIGNYASRYYYTSESMLGAYGLVRGSIPNTKLKWETNRKFNLGVDASLFKDKLNVSLDIYTSKTSDLINVKSISSASGLGYAIMNDGSMRNSGFDLNVNGRIIDNTNWKWDLGANISSYRNRLVSMSTTCTDYSYAGGTIRSKVGAPVGMFYGYKTAGIYHSAAEASAEGLSIRKSNGSLVAFAAGDVKFVDLNGDKVIDENDQTNIGNPNPDFFGSINSRVQWKRLSLSTIFSYSVGNDIYNALRMNLESMSNTDNQTISAIYRWKTNGQQTNTPKATYGDPMGNSRFSDRWIENGSYLRLKTITLSYDIPVKGNTINNLQVYVTANNLLTFTKYLGYDPEFSSSQSPLYYGVDCGTSPQQRSVLLGVKLGL